MCMNVNAFLAPSRLLPAEGRASTANMKHTRNGSHVGGRTSPLMIYPPPGSGYARPEDETSALPDTYEPMMEYPGTLRPGRTPSNMPYHDLPLDDIDTNPIPWPHFQEITWEHRWDLTGPPPITMEEFLKRRGIVASPPNTAANRVLDRYASRRMREKDEEKDHAVRLIVDDEDDEESSTTSPELGTRGIRAVVSRVLRTGRYSTPAETQTTETDAMGMGEGDKIETDEEDFLSQLGLDSSQGPMASPPGGRVEADAAGNDEEGEVDDNEDEVLGEHENRFKSGNS